MKRYVLPLIIGFSLVCGIVFAGTWLQTDGTNRYYKFSFDEKGIPAYNNYSTSTNNLFNKVWRDNVINVKADYECIGDGTTDDSANFQLAATAAATGKRLYVPGGYTFLIANIQIGNDTEIFGDGKLKLKVLGAGIGSPILDVQGSNVIIDGIEFDGNKAAQPADGFSDSFDGGAGGTGRAYRAAIKIDADTHSNSNVIVRNCYFENVFGACIAADNLDKIHVINNIAENCNFELAFLYNNAGAGSPTDALISGNRGYNLGSGDGSVNANAFVISNYTRVIFHNNQVYTVERNLVKLEGGNQAEITNNIVNNVTLSDYAAIQVQGTTNDLLIKGNVSKTTGKGIQMGGGASYTYSRVKVANNICSDINGTTTGDGFVCDSPINDFSLENNIFYNCQREGIYFSYGGNRGSIKNNKLYGDGDAGDYGIYIAAGAGNFVDLEIEGNEIKNFGTNAMELTRIAAYTFTNLTVKDNTLYCASVDGYGFYCGTADIITSGEISGNFTNGRMYVTQPRMWLHENRVAGLQSYTTGINAYDNTDVSTAGAGEDDLKSQTIGASLLGLEEGIKIIAAGTITGTNNTKIIKLYFGAQAWTIISAAAGDETTWRIEAEIFNAQATNAQKVSWKGLESDGTMTQNPYTTAAIDTTANVTLKLTGECTDAGDTITQTMWIVEKF